MRLYEITESMMSVGVQSRFPVSAGARGLLGARWRYDQAIAKNAKMAVHNAVAQLENNLKSIERSNYNSVDHLVYDLCSKNNIEPAELRKAFKTKLNCSPKEFLIKYKESRKGKPFYG